MTHLSPEALERLFTREWVDAVLCIHGLRAQVTDTPAGPLAVARIVAHLVLDDLPEEAAEAREDSYLVMDMPLTPAALALVSERFSETMDRMTETALERIITEDGDPWPGT